jgi:hypothetical protein
MSKMLGSGLAAAAVAGGLALAAPAHADSTFLTCGPGYGVEAHTSCPFAFNTRVAVNNQRGNPYLVYSPITQAGYEMYCGGTLVTLGGYSMSGLRCSGGDGAVVVLW